MDSNIEFFAEDISLPHLNYDRIKIWLIDIIEAKLMSCGSLSIIFCSDDYLLKVNQQYLAHDYYTDIITFNYSSKRIISGDMFISIDTVKSNASTYEVNYSQELTRVIFHGVFHLLGWDDHSAAEKLEMRRLENFWLQKYAVE